MNCVSCRKPLRKSNQTAADYPGTARHAGFGYCNTCRQKLKRDGVNPRTRPGPEFDVNFARYALASFLANLPSRKAKA